VTLVTVESSLKYRSGRSECLTSALSQVKRSAPKMHLTTSLLLAASATVLAEKYCCKSESPAVYSQALIDTIRPTRPHFHCSEHAMPFISATEATERGINAMNNGQLFCCRKVLNDNAESWSGSFMDVDCSYGAPTPPLTTGPKQQKSRTGWLDSLRGKK